MILTEEQRGAIEEAANICHEVTAFDVAAILQAMIDSSGTVEPTGGFDLERARGLRDFLQDDCAEVGDIWGEMIAEIERLRAENEEALESLTAAYLLGRHEKAQEVAARIKELEDAHKRAGAKYAKIINELRSSVYANIPGLDVGKIGPDAETGNRDHVVGPNQMVPNGKVWPIAEELRHCTSCGKSIEEIKGNLCKGDYFIGSIFIDPGQEGSRYDPPIEASYYFSCCDCSRSWQITEERVGLLEYCLETLLDAPDIEEIPGPGHSIEMLRAMLREAEQCE